MRYDQHWIWKKKRGARIRGLNTGFSCGSTDLLLLDTCSSSGFFLCWDEEERSKPTISRRKHCKSQWFLLTVTQRRTVGLLAPCSHPNHASNKFLACRQDSHTPLVGTPCSGAAAGHSYNPHYCYYLTPLDNPVTRQLVTRSAAIAQHCGSSSFRFTYFCFVLFFLTTQFNIKTRCRARVAMMIATAGLSGTTPLIATPPEDASRRTGRWAHPI